MWKITAFSYRGTRSCGWLQLFLHNSCLGKRLLPSHPDLPVGYLIFLLFSESLIIFLATQKTVIPTQIDERITHTTPQSAINTGSKGFPSSSGDAHASSNLSRTSNPEIKTCMSRYHDIGILKLSRYRSL
jgi:hypothetical protein